VNFKCRWRSGANRHQVHAGMERLDSPSCHQACANGNDKLLECRRHQHIAIRGQCRAPLLLVGKTSTSSHSCAGEDGRSGQDAARPTVPGRPTSWILRRWNGCELLPPAGVAKHPYKTPIYSHGRPNLLPPTGVNPKNPKVLRGEGGVPPGRAGAGPPGLPGKLRCRGDLSRELFDALVAQRARHTGAGGDAGGQQAFELAGAGPRHRVTWPSRPSRSGWKRWGRPDRHRLHHSHRAQRNQGLENSTWRRSCAPMSREARERIGPGHLGSGWGDADGGVQP
jgi:hypothetical protein